MKDAPAPDIIWFDPFSFKVDAKLWQVESFEKLLSYCSGKSTKLFNYTASTAARASMLAAGWFVGAGAGSGPKSETTIAYSPAAAENLPDGALLGSKWLSRWEKSDARTPFGDTGNSAIDRIRTHPQFQNLTETKPIG